MNAVQDEEMMFTDARIEAIMYQVTFNPKTRAGDIILNVSIVDKKNLEEVLEIFRQVMFSGLSVCSYIKMFEEGDTFYGITIPEGKVGIGTACSITIDGVLLKNGIPVRPKFGGIVQVKDREPIRFTDIISYTCTTIDPLEVLMSQELTSVRDMMRTGSGKILANYREVPMTAKDDVDRVINRLLTAGFYGILEVGEPNSPILGASVDRDHFGIIITGGTNPMAAVQEAGIPIQTKAIKGVIDFREMKKLV
jgi:repressor of nif and glnA expression